MKVNSYLFLTSLTSFVMLAGVPAAAESGAQGPRKVGDWHGHFGKLESGPKGYRSYWEIGRNGG